MAEPICGILVKVNRLSITFDFTCIHNFDAILSFPFRKAFGLVQKPLEVYFKFYTAGIH